MAAGNRLNRFLKIFSVVLISVSIMYWLVFELPFRGRPFGWQRHGNPPLTPPWALECWLWEDDSNTAGRVDTLLAGYARHDIPVRTILLDSPWSQRYNDFKADTFRYPDPELWFRRLQDNGYRVVLWMTSMVNSKNDDTRIRDSEDFWRSAKEKGYLAGKGDRIEWWKGQGGFVDYSSPEAMKWWHGMQETVFSYGIDGWKLDGTATLFHSKAGPIPLPWNSTHAGIMSTRRYMDHYYREEYSHGLEMNPEFVTLARSVDRGYHPEGFAPVDAAPVTWVGDQKHSWQSSRHTAPDGKLRKSDDGKDGLELAIKNILSAADLGYNIIGSDVAGFSGQSIQSELYIRWAQFSAFCGLFLNGGHGERALWNRSHEELEIIRRYSWLHTELIPYMYSYVVSAHNGGRVLQKPVRGKYHYLFGDNLLVAPIYRDDPANTITLPEGDWRYFFADDEIIRGPRTFKKEFPLGEYPVYVRNGAIIPMDIRRGYTGIGDRQSEGYLTLMIWPAGENEFTVYHPDRSGMTRIITRNSASGLSVSLEGVHKPHILNIKSESAPLSVELDGKGLRDKVDYRYDNNTRRLIIKTLDYAIGEYAIKLVSQAGKEELVSEK